MTIITNFLQLVATIMLLFAMGDPVSCFYFRKFPSKSRQSPGASQNLDHNVTVSLQELDVLLSRCGSKKVEIRELTIELAQKYFRSGFLTSFELTKCYLERIEKMDKHLKSVIEVNPDALDIAAKADRDRVSRKGTILSPLHGIPILIKDNIDTADRMETTCGAVAMELVKPKRDAEVVTRLRSAGAVILGKSNPVEWASFRSTDISDSVSWSGRGGKTWSPYNLTSSPSGSSVGSAVSIAANLALVALGSETDGSILSPSSRASLVGFKPTLGLVSTMGVIPLGFSQDVVGPMTRTVADGAIVMDVISDIRLRLGSRSRNMHQRSLSEKVFTLGVARGKYWNESDPIMGPILPKLFAAINLLRHTQQVKIIDPVPVTELPWLTDSNEIMVISHEFKSALNKYLQQDVLHLEGQLGRKIMSLADIIKFNIAFPTPEGYGQDLLILSDSTDGVQNVTYLKTRDNNKQGAMSIIDQALGITGCDAVISHCIGDYNLFYSVGAVAGYPSITVPVGVDHEGMPFGICITGKANSDLKLLEIGGVIENVMNLNFGFGRILPRFIQ